MKQTRLNETKGENEQKLESVSRHAHVQLIGLLRFSSFFFAFATGRARFPPIFLFEGLKFEVNTPGTRNIPFSDFITTYFLQPAGECRDISLAAISGLFSSLILAFPPLIPLEKFAD